MDHNEFQLDKDLITPVKEFLFKIVKKKELEQKLVDQMKSDQEGLSEEESDPDDNQEIDLFKDLNKKKKKSTSFREHKRNNYPMKYLDEKMMKSKGGGQSRNMNVSLNSSKGMRPKSSRTLIDEVDRKHAL